MEGFSNLRRNFELLTHKIANDAMRSVVDDINSTEPSLNIKSNSKTIDGNTIRLAAKGKSELDKDKVDILSQNIKDIIDKNFDQDTN